MLAHDAHHVLLSPLGPRTAHLFPETMTQKKKTVYALEHKLSVLESVAEATIGRNLVLRGLISLQVQKYLKESDDWWDGKMNITVNDWIDMAIADLKTSVESPQTSHKDPVQGYTAHLTRAFQ